MVCLLIRQFSFRKKLLEERGLAGSWAGHDNLFGMIRLNNQVDCALQFPFEILLGTFYISHYFAWYAHRRESQKLEGWMLQSRRLQRVSCSKSFGVKNIFSSRCRGSSGDI